MRTTALAGLGLGLVAAVVFASATTGPMLIRFLLLFVTPLPIALAGLGWGWRTGLLAGAAGTAIVFLFAGPVVAGAFAVTQVAPIVMLCYLALLGRPVAESGNGTVEDDGSGLEWYPVGRLILWAGAMAGLLAFTSMVVLGGDLEGLRKSLGEFLEKAVTASQPEGADATRLSEAEIAALSEMTLSVLPAASAMSWMGSLLFNLWLAGRVTLASGQLGRPWPDLSALTYPQGTPLLFGAALIGSVLAGYPGLAASAFGGALFVAYLLLGLAVIHYVTLGRPWRPFALWALYASLLLFNIWIGVVIVMLGLAETVLHIRARSQPPPGAPPPSNLNT